MRTTPSDIPEPSSCACADDSENRAKTMTGIARPLFDLPFFDLPLPDPALRDPAEPQSWNKSILPIMRYVHLVDIIIIMLGYRLRPGQVALPGSCGIHPRVSDIAGPDAEIRQDT
jgi:hypothetical protein